MRKLICSNVTAESSMIKTESTPSPMDVTAFETVVFSPAMVSERICVNVLLLDSAVCVEVPERRMMEREERSFNAFLFFFFISWRCEYEVEIRVQGTSLHPQLSISTPHVMLVLYYYHQI